MPLTPGTALGPFEIQALLGAGGMGEVYRARDTRLGRTVAIKVLSESVASDPAFRRRFDREGKTISSLNHPHICALYDVGEQDGVRYLVMEHVEGATLAEKLGRDGALPVDDAARYATQIADALEAAHEKGIVHRDLKPGNVMLTKSGCKVLDFGIATYAANAGGEAATQSVAGTAVGSIAGTLPYMSPEALRGSPADARSDVWALGVLLQEMVTGRRPFRGETAADVTSATLRDQPVRLSDGSPEWLVAVVGRCLAKDPNRRFQRAGEVRAALETSSAATGVALAIAIGWGLRDGRTPDPLPPSAGSPITSLAVLPLDNSSGDPDQEYLSDGMTDTLRAELAKIRSVRVISRTSVMTYKDTARPRLPEIARALGVDAIVEGSVARAGDEVRVTAQLIRGVTDETLWAESYQRDISDVLSLQSEIVRAIGREIQVVLSPDVEACLADRGPVDPDAYELTLRGHFYANQLSQETLERAIRYFEEAIEEDSAYAPAYAGLAFAYYSLSSVYVPPLDVMPLAREAATRAIELDPYLAAAHTWLGVVHLFFDYDWTAAERELRVAIDLDPSFAEARLGYGNYLLSVGRVEDAVTEVLAAEPLAPGSIVPYAHTMGSQWTAFMAQQYDLSIQKGREALTIDAGNAWRTRIWESPWSCRGRTPRGWRSCARPTDWRRSRCCRRFWLTDTRSAGRKPRLESCRRS